MYSLLPSPLVASHFVNFLVQRQHSFDFLSLVEVREKKGGLGANEREQTLNYTSEKQLHSKKDRD